jgi:hypothetical protein
MQEYVNFFFTNEECKYVTYNSSPLLYALYYYYYYYYYLLQLGFHPVAVVLTQVHTIQMEI